MIRVMHEEHAFSDLFLTFLLARSNTHPGGFGRSALQLQRKAPGANSPLDGGIRQTGGTGNLYSSYYAGNAGGDDRHHPIPRQLLMNRFRKLGFIDL